MHTSERLLSLDVFRGVTIAGMILVNNPGSWSHIYPPLRHAEWHGSTPTDWIFPFFLFIVGVAIPLSMDKHRERGISRQSLTGKTGRRTAVIFGWGLLLAAFPHFGLKGEYAHWAVPHYVLVGLLLAGLFVRELPALRKGGRRRSAMDLTLLALAAAAVILGIFAWDLSRLRIPGVLQRIALVYGACALLYLFAAWRTLLATGIALLVGYWGLMTLLPVPGGEAPNLEAGTDLGAWLDRAVLGTDHLWRQSKTWDPEGLLSTLPAIVTGVSGMLAGIWIKQERDGYQIVTGLLGAGIVGIGLGQAWGAVFPINKALWTSSYVFYTSGLALSFLGLLYWWVDVLKWRRWAAPWVVYGMNALFVFLASGLVVKLMLAVKWTDESGTARSLRGWVYESFFTPYFSEINASLAFAVANVAFFWGLAYWLYRRRIFIKV